MICDPNHSKIKKFLTVILGFSIKIIFLWNLFVFFVLINDFSTESTDNSRERREVSLSRPAASERLRGADLQLQLATAASLSWLSWLAVSHTTTQPKVLQFYKDFGKFNQKILKV